MNYGRAILLMDEQGYPNQRVGGAEPDVQTRGGVFGPHGEGGGIFDGAVALGALGADVAYPWKVKSDDTTALQAELNAWLGDRGYCPIGVDGELGPTTCGVIDFVATTEGGTDAAMQAAKANCQSSSFTPKKPPCPGGVVPKTTKPPATTTTVTPATATKKAGFMVWGLLALAAGAGAYVLTKKKGGRRRRR